MILHFIFFSSEASLVCHVCTVLAGGLVQKWMPKPGAQPPSTANLSGKKGVGRQGRVYSSLCTLGNEG